MKQDTYQIKVDNRPLKPHPDSNIKLSDKIFFAVLSDQTCIIGPYWQVWKRWRTDFRDKKIVEFHETRKKVTNSHLKDGVMSLSRFIEFDPKEYYPRW